MTTATRFGALCFSALALTACDPQARKQLEEIRAQQAEILVRLQTIEDAQKKAGAPRAAAPDGEDYDKVYTIPVGSSPLMGPADLPVTIVEFSDFQCPYCASAKPLLAQVLQKYEGRVNYTFKHFPLSFHPAAKPTAIASLAAQEQGKFWPMHDVLFQNQRTLDPGKLEEYAQAAGLDVERFKLDLASKRAEYEKRVDADFALGQSIDVRGTPTLYIGGKKVRVRTLEGMSAMIDEGINAAPGP